MTTNAMFLFVFLFLGTALMLSFASLRFATYQVALARGRRVKAVWRPFWMSARRRA